MADRKGRDEVKPTLSSLGPADREALGEAVLQDMAARDSGHVAERLRHVVEQLAAEGVFAGMDEAQVHAILREAVEDLGISPQRGAN
ncbi:hypothetical protein [Methylobacterium sp. SI9]|uniref:hypothetical protein n=1 Tax=Methylobacterium guangdongense TaxID=3138811 RepID=UPI00313F1FB5